MAVPPSPAAAPAPTSSFLHQIRYALGIGSFADWLFKLVCNFSAVSVILLVLLVVLLLTLQAWPAIRTYGFAPLLHSGWDPVREQERPELERERTAHAPMKPAAEALYKEFTGLDQREALDVDEAGHAGKWDLVPFAVGPQVTVETTETVQDEPVPFGFGALTFIYGSVVTSFISMLLAVPLGVGTATYLAEIAHPTIKRVGSFFVELLAAIPSVVYGFWGIIFLAPWLGAAFHSIGVSSSGGKSLLTASVILAIMIVPYVAAVAYDVCQAVPRAQREGSLALGATRWQTIWRVVLPYARPGIIGGSFLALGRALGETMAVTMLIGNINYFESFVGRVNGETVLGRGNTIPSIIALQLPGTSGPMETSVLVEMGLLLFAVTIAMNVLARLLIWRMGKTSSRGPLWLRLFAHAATTGSTPAAESQVAAALSASRLKSHSPRRQTLPSNARGAGLMDKIMTGLLGLCLVITCIPLFLILGYIVYKGFGSLNLDFFIEDHLPYTTKLPLGPENKPGGLRNALLGSGMIVGLATLFAVPLGLLAAIYLAEYRTSRIVPTVRFFGELLNGVPSIVVGTFVYALVRYCIEMHWLPPDRQFSAIAGALALAIMMIPIVMRSSEEALRLVPQALRNASHALGAHHWQTVIRVSVPAALPAIITGAFLAIARIAGETAPLLITAFGNEHVNFDPRNETAFLPGYIYLYGKSGDDAVQVPMAWAAALVLLAFIMLLNIGIRVATGKRVVLASRAE
jgi:phosphate transport system permease protein